MHNAPAVSFPVGRSRFQAWCRLGVWVAGAAGCIYWASVMDVAGWRHALALVMPVAAGAAAWWSWRHPAGGRLHWDGQYWRLDAAASAKAITAAAWQTAGTSPSMPDTGARVGIGGGSEVGEMGEVDEVGDVGDMAVKDLSVHLDLQDFLLLRLRLMDPSMRGSVSGSNSGSISGSHRGPLSGTFRRPLNGPVRWLWLDQRAAPAQWQALRRAVYANAASQRVPAAPPLQKAKA